MSRLDDEKFVRQNDPNGIYDLTLGFPEQCREALKIARGASLPRWSARPDAVFQTGLGGSAAGGDFVKALFEEGGVAPFSVNRDYRMPAYVNSGSLVFATSYSGNTEETVAAYKHARSQGASLIAVTSGGKLEQLAKQDGFPLIKVPGGQPPRTALGYMLIPVVFCCQSLGLIPEQDFEEAFQEIESCSVDYRIDAVADQNPTKQLAESLAGKVATIYGLGGWQAVIASRWKSQLNENSKYMAFANAFPELCHNEIIGWVGAKEQGVKQWISVLLKDGTESDKMKARADITFRLVQDQTERQDVNARGKGLLAKMLSLTYFGDFVSVYLAALTGHDPEKIDNIHTLKAELSKVE
ncbi:MAG: bifunctional phosphoglucose/phosphomannose isomerase [Fimbriimonadaceae bacterium]